MMKYFILLVIAFLASICWAQNTDVYFSRLSHTNKEEVLVNNVQTFFQDKLGQLWICSNSGIKIFDGHEVVNMMSNPIDKNSLASNTIQDLVEDDFGNFWIVTEDYGMCFYNPKTNMYKNYKHDAHNQNSLLENELLCIAKGDGKLWVGGYKGLNLFNPMTEKTTRFSPGKGEGQLKSGYIKSIIPLKNRVAVSTFFGFEILNLTTNKWTSIAYKDLQIDADYPAPLLKINASFIYIGLTKDGNIAAYDIEKDHFINLSIKSSIKIQGELRDWQMDVDQKLWLIVDDYLYRLSSDKTKVEIKINKKNIGQEVESAWQLNKLFIDKQGLLWIGKTGVTHVYFYNPKQELYIKSGLPSHDSLSDIPWIKFSKDGILWMNSKKGLAKYNDRNGEIKYYPIYGSNNCLFTKDGNLLLIKSEKLVLLNPKDGKIISISIDKSLPQNLGYLLDGAFDFDGDLWLTTWGNGLVMVKKQDFDEKVGLIKHYTHWSQYNKDKRILKSNALQSLLISSSNKVWISGANNGLLLIDKSKETTKYYLYNQGDKNSISSNYTLSLAEDRLGKIWITTQKSGINKFDPTTQKFKQFNEDKGFQDDWMNRIINDSNGDVWVNHRKGILKINHKNDILHYYGNANDIEGGYGSIAESKRSGEVYFQSLDGIIRKFIPEKIYNNLPSKNNLKILRLNYLDPKSKLMKPFIGSIEDVKKISLDYNSNTISIVFSALDFIDPAKYSYQYSLTSSPEVINWVNLKNKNILELNQLGSGTYFLKIKAEKQIGDTFEMVRSLVIVIKNPWWSSMLAKIFYALCLLALLYFWFKNWERKLQKKIELDEEKKEQDNYKIIQDFKSKFYANITHEFRTPLTVILGMAQDKNQLIENSESSSKLISSNANFLLNLVNQILDIGKIESNAYPVNWANDDIAAIIKDVIDDIKPLAAKKDINIIFDENPTSILANIDRYILKKILINILNNAIKFSNTGGTILVKIFEVKNHINILIEDFGIGIPSLELDSIFKRYYQIKQVNENDYKSLGTGIGLSYVKELVGLIGGDITVSSELNVGSKFTVKLPSAKTENIHVLEKENFNFNKLFESENSTEVNDRIEILSDSEKPLLLIVEDNEDLIEYLMLILKNKYNIVFSRDGQNGIDIALEKVPDLIISDVMMPHKDGYELCDILKNNPITNHIPIVLLTAKTSDESRMKGLGRGADAYLTKPFLQQELFIVLEKLHLLRLVLLQKYSAKTSPPSSSHILPDATASYQDVDSELLETLNQIIETHISSEKLSPSYIASFTPYNQLQLTRKVKAIKGVTLVSYIKNCRLEKAMFMLENENLNIAEIAYKVGFNDPAYFSRAFADYFGLPPSDVKNR